MSRNFAFAILAAASTLGLPRTASASGITFVESAYGLNFGCTTACPQPDGLSNFLTTITTTSLLSFSQTFISGANTTTFSAQTQSSPGSLHASASASYSRTGVSDSRFVYASSLFRELMTVNSATLDGQPGTLTFTFNLDGTISESGTGNALAYVGLGAGTVSNPEAYGEQFFAFEPPAGGSVNINNSVTLAVPIVYGREFLFTAALGTFAGGIELCPVAEQGTSTCPLGVRGRPTLGVGSGSSSFFNTLQLTGLTPTSSNQLVTDAVFASGSGTQYSTNGVVPEPGSIALLGTGLALGVLRSRRRRTNS